MKVVSYFICENINSYIKIKVVRYKYPCLPVLGDQTETNNVVSKQFVQTEIWQVLPTALDEQNILRSEKFLLNLK